MPEKPKLEPGRKRCLKCRKWFDSWDVKLNHICPPCDRSNQREYIPRIAGSRVHGNGSRSSVDDGS